MSGLASFLILFTLSGCTGQLIHHWQETSRDYTYIDFSRNPSPYKFSGQVGGEHITYVKVLGFKGDHFTVAMQQEGDAGFIVYGEGVTVRQRAGIAHVKTEATDSLFTIQISALSYGDYVLTITPK
jgi:hypothetical protein